MEQVTLSNGVQIPVQGMGTWQITDRELMKTIIAAGFASGYRLIDTAAAYGNEIALSKTIRTLGLQREELFLSDKVWNTCRGYEEVQTACKNSLKKLKTDYLDLYLIHWPASPAVHPNWQEINRETWRGMEKLYQEGLVRAIGVCNFKRHHLEVLLQEATIVPMVNQFECHPGMPQTDLVVYCQKKNIVIEASSPLGNGQILANEQLKAIAARNNKTVSQICLRWALQKGIITIPKTTKPARILENMDIFDFNLTDEEMALIDAVPYCGGLNIDADEVKDFG